MRGKAPATSLTVRTSGITPAYAGKSHTVNPEHFFTWDHPRLCGEKKNLLY